ncbi:membrane fusion protein, multidrug efflux system [Thalassovita litoralis]|uniref:Membrane fusion protein, multidrug efflux system n=1 Tax=Thalassovita litoralis TaxID=1010611 RepID=A0A521DZ42_9RHOB|nr:efflux RND transporter periplasmic adaptor subunit [Thalassovita litoralis]SMO76966.1 membrane fusion protein, multidrug efflux system [Thalassovita litoralis]
MRPIPVLTAILVTAFLYVLVMEREALMAFALSGDVEQAIEVANTNDTTPEVTKPDRPTHKPVGVVALHSTAQVIDSAVVLRGETQAMRQVDVRAETTAQVVSDPLRRGAYVERGQTLCELDPGTRPASLAEAQAGLASARARIPEAQANLKKAEAALHEATINYNVAKKLNTSGYAAETRLAGAEAAAKAAEAGVESARSGLETVQANIESAQAAVAARQKEIDRLTITAPFTGLLESDSAELGSLLQSGGLCATVIQLNPIKLVGYVPETEIDRVSVGALAGTRLTTGTQVQGRVTFLSRSADPQTRTFRVDIDVANPDLKIRDGQTAEILIASDGAKAHLLPQSALTLNDDGKLGVRLVGANNIVAFAPITLVRDTAQGVWITGLDETADVIIVGQEYVTAGVTVAPTFQEVAQ